MQIVSSAGFPIPTSLANCTGHLKKNIPIVQHRPSVTRSYTRPLSDDELRSELEANDTICLMREGISWQQIERQVERLGFGAAYIVSSTQRPQGSAKIILKPGMTLRRVESRQN